MGLSAAANKCYTPQDNYDEIGSSYIGAFGNCWGNNNFPANKYLSNRDCTSLAYAYGYRYNDVLEDVGKLVPCPALGTSYSRQLTTIKTFTESNDSVAIYAISIINTTPNVSHFVAGEDVYFNTKVVNPFKHDIELQGIIYAYVHFNDTDNSINYLTAFHLYSGTQTFPKNAQTVLGNSDPLTMPAPVIKNGTLYNRIRIYILPHTKIDLQSTTVGDYINAYPTLLFSACTATDIVLNRPYLKITRTSGSGALTAGETATITVTAYNPNPYSATGMGVTFSLSGSGLSGDAGSISGNLSNISINSTSNYASESSYATTTRTATYTAPSSTSSGSVTISATFSGCSIDGRTGITGTCVSSITIDISEDTSNVRYMPFYMHDLDTGGYLEAADIPTYFGSNTVTVTMNPCGDIAMTEYNGTLSTMNNGYGQTIFYYPTTDTTELKYDESCSPIVIQGIDYEFSIDPSIFNNDYTLPSTATLAAFNAAGIFTLEGNYTGVEPDGD